MKKGLTTRVAPSYLSNKDRNVPLSLNTRVSSYNLTGLVNDSYLSSSKKKSMGVISPQPPLVKEAHMLRKWNSNRQKRVPPLLDLLFSGSGKSSALIERSSR